MFAFQQVELEALEDLLASFGIDMAVLEPTERTQADLDICESARLKELRGKRHPSVLQPLTGPRLTGLVNLGNTCYVNSVCCLSDLKLALLKSQRCAGV